MKKIYKIKFEIIKQFGVHDYAICTNHKLAFLFFPGCYRNFIKISKSEVV